jgi:hypothetical protein
LVLAQFEFKLLARGLVGLFLQLVNPLARRPFAVEQRVEALISPRLSGQRRPNENRPCRSASVCS